MHITHRKANITEKRQISVEICRFSGGANEIRTRDLLNAIQTRYQLRYNPVILF